VALFEGEFGRRETRPAVRISEVLRSPESVL
jgi:hypothetical protein